MHVEIAGRLFYFRYLRLCSSFRFADTKHCKCRDGLCLFLWFQLNFIIVMLYYKIVLSWLQPVNVKVDFGARVNFLGDLRDHVSVGDQRVLKSKDLHNDTRPRSFVVFYLSLLNDFLLLFV